MATPAEMDKVSAEDDALLFDNSGDLQSAQKDASLPDRLSAENFRIVKHLTDKIRNHTVSRNKSKAFMEHNVRIYDQRIKPRWLPASPSPPLLPGSASFTAELHQEWNQLIAKTERKLHKKVVNALPDIINSLELTIQQEREKGMEEIRNSITHPGQRRRAELVFAKLINNIEHQAVWSRPRGNHSSRHQGRR